jgi:anti-sigma B factor antagonist
MPRLNLVPGNATDLPPAFACSWRDGGSVGAWVYVSGELDLATTPQFEQTLRAAQADAELVILDLRGLVFIDSSAMHVIIDASVQAREVGRRLVLLRASTNVERMFKLAGAQDDVEIVDLAPAAGP